MSKYNGDKRIEIQNIGDLCKKHMQIFGANNNLMRHLPSLVDGLKPVERRILWAMYNDLNSAPNKNTIKVSKIVGSVIGGYHPHGDASVKETIVRLAQPWNNIECLIEGQGNFGSISGEKSAAARYIEAKISKYAYKCFFEDFKIDFINTKPNYLGDTVEPEYLPARYPNVLINYSFGIGYGTSTGIPTYNLREVLEATIKLIDDPLTDDILLIPDIPTGSLIIDDGQFETISKTGRGKLRLRGQIDIDKEKNELIIRSVPIQVSAQTIIDKIIELQDKNIIQGIINIADDSSSTEGVKIHLSLKKEIDPLAIMHTIYKRTQLEDSSSIIFKLIDDYQEYEYNIKSLLLEWIDFRREVKRNQYNYYLVQNIERQHILETILMIFDGKNAEKSLSVIRKAESREEVIEYLMNEYKISSIQARSIADMRLSSFTKSSIRRLREEKKEVDNNVKKINKILRSSSKIDKIIKDELIEGIELFGKPRKSKVITLDGELKISDTNHIIVVTMKGFIKKLPDESKSIGFINQGDYPIEIIHINNLDNLLIFDETGKISNIAVSDIPNTQYTSEGELLQKYANINGKISSIIIKPKEEIIEKIKEPIYFIMITKNGLVKKTNISHYLNIKNELLGMIIKDGDELQSVKILLGDKDLLLFTSKGYGIRFNSSDIKDTGRMSIGVRAIDMVEDEHLIGIDIINNKDKFILCLTNKGNAKKCTLDNFRTMDRASKPLRLISLDNSEDVILIRTVRGDELFKAYLKSTVQEFNISDVVELPRLSKGKKLIKLFNKGEVIIDIKEVK